MLNVEVKARCNKPDFIRAVLEEYKAEFRGTDHQIDTYFKIEEGRLKLREGTIGHNLIYYKRSNTKKPKVSDINLVHMKDSGDLKKLLTRALGINVVVDKHREIYFIDNVKFHIDRVDQLGCFLEIEAIDKDGSIGEGQLHEQCDYYLNLFGVRKKNLVAVSYSDLLME